MISPFEAVVEWYSDVDGEIKVSHIITFGNTFIEAMKHIESYFGEKSLDKVTLYMLEEATVYEMENLTDEYSHGMFKLENGTITEWKSNQA